VGWTIEFDGAGLSDAERREVSAALQGNLQILSRARKTLDEARDRALVEELISLLSTQFTRVPFRMIYEK
jgi:hypothetical protein